MSTLTRRVVELGGSWSELDLLTQVPTADLALRREYMRAKRMEVFNNAKLGCVAATSHKIAFHKTNEPADKWYL